MFLLAKERPPPSISYKEINSSFISNCTTTTKDYDICLSSNNFGQKNIFHIPITSSRIQAAKHYRSTNADVPSSYVHGIYRFFTLQSIFCTRFREFIYDMRMVRSRSRGSGLERRVAAGACGCPSRCQTLLRAVIASVRCRSTS